MSMTQTTPAPVIEDDIFDEADRFEKRGNWTEERHEILDSLSEAEIDADIMRIQAAHPGRFLSAEQLQEKVRRMEEELMAGRHADLVRA